MNARHPWHDSIPLEAGRHRDGIVPPDLPHRLSGGSDKGTQECAGVAMNPLTIRLRDTACKLEMAAITAGLRFVDEIWAEQHPHLTSATPAHDYSLGGDHVAQSPERRSRHLQEVATCVGRDDTGPEDGPRRKLPRDRQHGPYQRHRRPPSDTRGLNGGETCNFGWISWFCDEDQDSPLAARRTVSGSRRGHHVR